MFWVEPRAQDSVGRGGNPGPDQGLGVSLGGCLELLGARDWTLRRESRVATDLCAPASFGGCSPISQPNSGPGGADRRGTFLTAGTFPRATQQSGAALAGL